VRLKKVIFSAVIMFVFITSKISAYAQGITLDGQFNDWSDKPELTDPQGDEEPPEDILSVKWFPDAESGNLYFYVERLQLGDKKNDKDKDKDENDDDNEYIDENEIYDDIVNNLLPGGNSRFEYWVLNARFSSEKGDRLAVIINHPPSRKVSVYLYDEDGDYLWSVTGKWGEDKGKDKDGGKRIEFYIPFSQLVDSIQSGYFIKLLLRCENDRVPDSGEIIISTINTYPALTVTILGLFVISGLVIFGLNRRFALKK